jgi:serine/threonine protein kinase
MQTPKETWEIPGYEIQNKIGEGGMGQVFRAVQLSLQRPVAIKILNPLLQDQSPLLGFTHESQLMASLAHPNVVAIHDCGRIDEQNFLIMEHVAGKSLREQMVDGQPWSTGRAIRVLDMVAQALTYIHSKGILHLDLKPENVLYTSEGVVKVTDFGLAIPQSDALNVSDLSWVQGSVDYCSPEQRYGLPQDQRSDVFSLAVLAYELLTGRVPGRFYVAASQRNPRLPARVDEVLRRGLARDANERYATVEEFRCDLKLVLDPRPQRTAFRISLAVTAAIVLGVAFVYFFRPFSKNSNSELADIVPAPARAWHIFGSPDNAWGFDDENEEGPRRIAATPVVRLNLQSLPPGEKLDRLVPDWPYPLPCLVLNDSDRWCFFHPLGPQSFGPSELGYWSKLFEIPPLASQDNFVRAGRFEGNCLGGDSGAWRIGVTRTEKDLPPIVHLGNPPDQPQNQALCLTKTSSNPDQEMVCYQWLAREPRRPKTFMILRYRARAEIGEPSVAIGVIHPLEIPKSDQSLTACWLRRQLRAEDGPPRSDADVGQFWINDWVTVTQQWQTYCVVWQWPPYCNSASRNLLIHFAGEGKLWIDNVELFTWDREVNP